MSKPVIISDERIKEVALHTAGVAIDRRYENSLAVSGWVLKKPKIFVNAGFTSATIELHQFVYTKDGELSDRFYSIISYATNIIDKLKAQDNVYFLCVSGQVTFNVKQKRFNLQALDIEIPMSLPGIELLESES